MISNKARYAFRALLAIAEMPDGQPLTSTEIATRHAIPHKFLEQILVDLRNAGLLESRRGKRSEEHTSELQSLMRISYAVFCLKKKKLTDSTNHYNQIQPVLEQVHHIQ